MKVVFAAAPLPVCLSQPQRHSTPPPPTTMRRPRQQLLALALCAATAMATAAPPRAGSGTTWQKVLLPTTGGATCLDGSPGGYFLRANPASASWVVFHQGGGWCSSPDNCAARATGDLGSSLHWPSTYDDTYEGSEMFATAPFNEYNVVYAMYCDGGSWSGDVDVPYNGTAWNGTTLHYRGRRLLDAMLDDLLFTRGMQDADTVVYSGCSAGGLTTYLHSDYVRARVHAVSPNAAVLAVADAMFSLDHDSFAGQPQFQPRMQWGFSAWNSSAGVNADCLAHYGEADGYKCMFGENAARFVQTPTMIINSKYDTWQEAAILGLNCSVGQCDPAAEAFWVEYGHAMVAALDQVPPRHGAFLTNCPAHCQTGTGGDWTKRSVNGTALGIAVATWFNTTLPVVRVGGTPHSQRWVADCDEKPCGTDVC